MKEEIPRQQFPIPLQASIGAKIIAREDVKGFRKDVTAKLYGGDYTRRLKLLEKQKKGKKKIENDRASKHPSRSVLKYIKNIMIKKLTLTNFRKFETKTLEFDKNIVIFYGHNAQGKSSILEAIYLINTGISPWASMNEFVNINQSNQIFTRIESLEDDKSFVYYKDEEKRIFKIDGKNTIPSKFFENRSANIFNPEKIELLMISPSQRREFLDDTILKYDYEYQTLIKDFKKILRQRNAYLKKLAKLFYDKGVIAINDPQLNFWSNHFSLTSAYILQNRIKLIKELSNNEYEIKYKTDIDFDKES